MVKYIECYGLSGAGKSTAANFFHELHLIPLASRSKTKFSYFSLSFFLSFIFSLLLVLRIFLITKINIINLYKPFILCYYYLLNYKKTGYVTGHGFIQCLTQNENLEKVLSKNPLLLSKIISYFPKNILFIYIFVSKEEAVKRAKGRNSNNHLSEKYDLDNLFFLNLIKLKFGRKLDNSKNDLVFLKKKIRSFI